MLIEISYILKKSISQFQYIFETFSYAEYTFLEVLEHIADENISDVDLMWRDEEDSDIHI